MSTQLALPALTATGVLTSSRPPGRSVVIAVSAWGCCSTCHALAVDGMDTGAAASVLEVRCALSLGGGGRRAQDSTVEPLSVSHAVACWLSRDAIMPCRLCIAGIRRCRFCLAGIWRCKFCLACNNWRTWGGLLHDVKPVQQASSLPQPSICIRQHPAALQSSSVLPQYKSAASSFTC